MKTVRVAAALIIDGNRVMATQRNYGDFAGGWEFPGGKIEQGETPEEALEREIKEELGLGIRSIEFFKNVRYQYETFFLDMDCFTCEIESGKLELHDHSSMKWLDSRSLYDVEWLPADVGIIEDLKIRLAG
ncbi:(deoxy)nucleoside triphosphate pyrophosphohydrolase [Paraeggerthella hongkongensis]|uniref:8-oxo-dGTP diphosphatase n=1 Tax=Paraeggerthella hongkongensis TaxID=230658 RepID=A0A3N0BEG5_9ACTN|nr:(deoxy)nucleoside triphosphate pyrophosphohydrolase [Paraeggerthella hongkongensis]RNL46098.1 8-oxo-dGTP diphosphatase MutT [Paraeggerthella hongkongensis]